MLLTAGVALVFGISAYVALSWVIRSEETVVVPKLQGKSAVAVLTLLSGMDLNAKVDGSEYSDTVAKDHVIRQSPSPGTEIKQGRNIQISFSKGPAKVSMPDLRGIPVNRAQVVLEKNGLCRRHTSFIHSAAVEKNRIISQHPATGQRIPRETCADLLVSLGALTETYAMPDIRGKSMEKAVSVIEQMGLTIGVLNTRQGLAVPDNAVWEQAPAAGHRIASGNPVDLVIHKEGSHSGSIGELPLTEKWWFSYRLPWGFLNRQLEIRQKESESEKIIFQDFVKPVSEIFAPVSSEGAPVLYVYIDGELSDVIVSKNAPLHASFSKNVSNQLPRPLTDRN